MNTYDSRRIPIVVTQRLEPQRARRGPGATVTSSRARNGLPTTFSAADASLLSRKSI